VLLGISNIGVIGIPTNTLLAAGIDRMELQDRMNAAFENYLELSDILTADGLELLESEKSDERWQRNYLRTSVALIEGYSHCFREMAAIGLECNSTEIPKNERDVLISEANVDTNNRIKLTLRATYRMFGIKPIPDFSSENWVNAKLGLEKRHSLMHPKNPSDLKISHDEWSQIYSGISWLIEQHFNLVKFLYEKYVTKRS